MSFAPPQQHKSPESRLEEGNLHSIDHAAGAGAAPAPHHKEHHKRWHHHMKRQKHKQKVESKLPGVMQGAEDLQEAERRLKIKNEGIACIGEFIGTFLFLFLSYGIATVAGEQSQSANGTQDASQLLYSSLGFGFALAVNVWLFFRVSGGLFNPAVTLALFLTKSLTWYRFILLLPVQFIAGIAAAGMAAVLIPGGENAGTKLSGKTTIAQGFFIEMFMTAQLVFAVFMLAGEKHKGTFLAPVGIGLALFMAELWATPFTGGSLNPARSLGPDVISAKFQGTTWIYYTAPFVGALIATAIYSFLKYAQYETAVEGQDDDAIKLVMRDKDGGVTGFVDQVKENQAPEEIAKAQQPSRPASIISVDDTAVEGNRDSVQQGTGTGTTTSPAGQGQGLGGTDAPAHP